MGNPLPNFRISSIKPADYEINLVEDVILRDMKVWNVNAMKQVIRSEEWEAISHIPIAKQMGTDKLVWDPSPKGVYNVKSGSATQKLRLRNTYSFPAVGPISHHRYLIQDPGTKPATRVWPSINVGTEIYVSSEGAGVTAEWAVSDFDVLVLEDATSDGRGFL
ncbi:unnamed protein product [Ilex paraguariensis]|uniref:DUF7705 domain-containing protein n=1 Tax=Ilex paraguariensis TaxID=185542 RepID=A0ABC8TEK8_9AQUA